QLDARIAKYDLLCHPFYKTWAAGELSREDLREYAHEYFHHVEAFPSYLDEFAARLPHGHMRRAVLANREEEAGGDGSHPHAELWLDFVECMGGNRVTGAARVPEIKSLIASFHAVAREGAPEEVWAAV